MESQYLHFGPKDQSSGEHNMSAQSALRGRKRILVRVFYGVLVLLLLILLMVTVTKVSQFNQELTDVKLKLKILNERTSSSSPGATTGQVVILPRLVPVRGRAGCLCSQAATGYQPRPRPGAKQRSAVENKEHLVVLNNVEELDYISKVVHIKYHYWIGLVEREHEGQWSWVDGTDFNSTQTFWDDGQPDNWDWSENGEDCAQIHASERRKRKMWNDADCHLPNKYVCKTRA
ncbi:uncharacterized protein LOC120830663 [Gasterosteus aculeatus]